MQKNHCYITGTGETRRRYGIASHSIISTRCTLNLTRGETLRNFTEI